MFAALLAAALFNSTALAHGPKVSFGINFGFPVYGGPWCHHHHYCPGYYAPRAVIIERPVLVAPTPVVVQQPAVVIPPAAPVVQPAPVVKPAPQYVPSATTTSTFQTANLQKTGEVEQLLQLLNDPDDKLRAEAVIQLGRLKADRAVDPLAATLASDRSPAVRDSAARALGLIGAPRALTALIHAGNADPDNDVRRSAQFAVEIIKLNHGLK
jgi:hypothetical protein